METYLDMSLGTQRFNHADKDGPRGHRALPRHKWRRRQPTVVSRHYEGASLQPSHERKGTERFAVNTTQL